ncbi:ParB/Sulfiredoxin [Paraphysoderma sedebokerense]|nr:ParB/Sulfiredoxin [Paraphysoderma sedebokerense]
MIHQSHRRHYYGTRCRLADSSCHWGMKLRYRYKLPQVVIMSTSSVISTAGSTAGSSSTATDSDKHKSIFVSDETEPIEIPMNVVSRPIQSVLDEAKVMEFMESIKAGDQFTPIEVLHLQRPNRSNPSEPYNYYFAFGGCHRWEAHKRLNCRNIRARIIPVTEDTIRAPVGDSLKFKEP